MRAFVALQRALFLELLGVPLFDRSEPGEPVEYRLLFDRTYLGLSFSWLVPLVRLLGGKCSVRNSTRRIPNVVELRIHIAFQWAFVFCPNICVHVWLHCLSFTRHNTVCSFFITFSLPGSSESENQASNCSASPNTSGTDDSARENNRLGLKNQLFSICGNK